MIKNIFDPEILDYCVAKGVREPAAIQKLREYSSSLDNGRMLITPIQGAFLSLLIKLTNVKNILEIGTFTGYSAAWMGNAIPSNGKLITLDISHEHINHAIQCWTNLNIKQQIEAKLGDAIELMNQFIANKQIFDLVFIDANKAQYIEYYELSLQLLNSGGIIIIDNVLMYGQVLDKNPQKKYLKVLQTLNDIIIADNRVEVCMLPVGDGLTIVRKN